jgi:hypothetical protein
MKMAKTKERMLAKSQARANAKAAEQLQAQQQQQSQKPALTDEELLKLFSTEEKPQRTPRGANSTFGKGGAKNGEKKKKK